MHQDSSEESWLEEQCHRDIDAQNEEGEQQYVRHRDSSLSTVWGAFQDSATAVAHLYRERSSNAYPDTGALWLPFQTAAGTVTTLYKESCEGIKRTSEAAIQYGYQRRNRELADWARSKKRRMIRREDLLAYLAGKPPPPAAQHLNRRSPKPEMNTHNNVLLGNNAFALPMATHQLPPHGHLHTSTASNNDSNANNTNTNDLHTFREALLRPRGTELFAFVANELARHCKRPASPSDDKMDVCHYNSKRPRFM